MLISAHVLFSRFSLRFLSHDENALETSRLDALKFFALPQIDCYFVSHLFVLLSGSLIENNGPTWSFAAIFCAALELCFIFKKSAYLEHSKNSPRISSLKHASGGCKHSFTISFVQFCRDCSYADV